LLETEKLNKFVKSYSVEYMEKHISPLRLNYL